jgi:hypothetical protein
MQSNSQSSRQNCGHCHNVVTTSDGGFVSAQLGLSNEWGHAGETFVTVNIVSYLSPEKLRKGQQDTSKGQTKVR